MEWDDLLRRRHAMRWIFGAVIALILLLIATRFAVLPRVWAPREPLGPFNSTYPNALLSLIDAAVSTLTTVGLTGSFLYLLVPRDVREGKVITVHPKDIAAELKADVEGTREYFFRGRSGRYFRSMILPLIEAGSRSASATRVIWVLLPDPADAHLMDSYARFRNSAAFRGKKTAWTSWDISVEIVATVAVFAEKAMRNPHLEFHVGLSRTFSLLRLDMTDISVVLTRDDPKLPAFKASCGTVFYESHREDIQLSIGLAGEVDLKAVWPDTSGIDASGAAVALQAMGLVSEARDPSKVEAVVTAMKNVTNPYA